MVACMSVVIEFILCDTRIGVGLHHSSLSVNIPLVNKVSKYITLYCSNTTRLMRDEIFYDGFIANLLLSLTAKKLENWSAFQKVTGKCMSSTFLTDSGRFFHHTVCMPVTMLRSCLFVAPSLIFKQFIQQQVEDS